MTRDAARAIKRTEIMDTLMDIEAAQRPHRRGATAKQIAEQSGLDYRQVLAELRVLVEDDPRRLVEVDHDRTAGPTRPTSIYRMRRTKKVASHA